MRIEALEVRDGDVLVVTSPDHLSKEASTIILQRMEEKFPGHKVLVLSAGLSLQVLRPAA